MNEPDYSFLSVAERKRLLIAQGAAFRNAITHGTREAQASLRPKALASGVLGHIVPLLSSFLGGGAGAAGGLDIAAMLPMVISGASALGKRVSFKRALKPVLGGAVMLGVLGLAATLVKRKRKRRVRQ